MLDINTNSKIVRILFDFYNNDEEAMNTRDEVIEYVKNSPKPFLYTYGFTWKNPTTKHVPVINYMAMDIIKNESYLKVTEHEDFYHLNAFGANDLW